MTKVDGGGTQRALVDCSISNFDIWRCLQLPRERTQYLTKYLRVTQRVAYGPIARVGTIRNFKSLISIERRWAIKQETTEFQKNAYLLFIKVYNKYV